MLEGLRSLRGRFPAFVLGASAGAVLTWLLSRGSRGADGAGIEEALGGRRQGGRAIWADALEGALTTLESARERLMGDDDPLIDLEPLRTSLGGVPGAERVHLRDLGGGIVEALGTAPDAGTVQQILDKLRAGEGVTVVVNRIWTPASATERAADLSPPDDAPKVTPDA